MDELLLFLLKEGSVLEVTEYCGEDALKDMWIELITYVSSKAHSNPEYLITLLKK